MSNRAASDFTTGAMPRHVLRLSGFMIMGFVAMTVAQVVEAAYLGMLGSAELAAAAFTFPVVMAFNAATRGIGVGTGAVLARAIGEGNRARAARLATHGLLLAFGFSLGCAVLVAWQAPAIFSVLGAQDHVLSLASAYMAIWCIGFPGFAVAMVGAGLMRSAGDPAFPGYVMTAGSVLQMLFGPPLIFGWFGIPPLGIEGAAWAFVLARAVSCAMTLWWFFRKGRLILWAAAEFGSSARDILHVGLPAGATNLINPLSAAVTTRILAEHGSAVVAGFGVATRIDAVVSMIVIGIAASAAPLVGQNWGAKHYDRVDEALRLGYVYCMAWGVIASAIMWVGAPFFVGLITDAPEPAKVAVQFLYVVPLSLGFMGMINVATASFNALSQPAPPLILSVLRLFAFFAPLAVLGGALFGPLGVFAAMALANVVFGFWSWLWNRRVLKRLRPTADRG